MPPRRPPSRGPSPRRPRLDRKLLQLCKQVRRAIDLAIVGECEALARHQVYVSSVSPAPDALRMRVELVVPPTTSDADLASAHEQLSFAQPFLRNQVAQAINRHRVPELAFVLARAEIAEAPPPPPPRARDDDE